MQIISTLSNNASFYSPALPLLKANGFTNRKAKLKALYIKRNEAS